MSRRWTIALAILLVLIVLAAGGIWWATSDHIERLPVTPAQRALADQASRAGATDVDANGRRDGGMTIGGKIDGHQFAVAIPPKWNHQALLFAHGYSPPGSSVAVARDPVAKDPGGSALGIAYAQGFAVGHSAYDKAGVGVESGVENTLALKHLLDRLGVTRTYIAGGSMGGTITVALIEQHPNDFAGALAACGPASWQSEIGALTDFRALYNYFTRGTPYALPGAQSIKVSALSSKAPWPLHVAQPLWTAMQVKRLAKPVERLFLDARKNPKGQAAAIIRNIASASNGEFGPEFASFAFPLVTIGLGQDDMVATMGGEVHDSRNEVYHSAYLSDAQNAALNRGIERVAADPKAVAYAMTWHEPSGRSPVKLVTIHNRIDSLVPYKRETELAARMAAAGNSANLLALTVPPMVIKLPGVSLPGYAHCGFTPDQTRFAWNSLRLWVETGAKPAVPAELH
jgi:pimeloyl-ACP methyl ester carboxylesterase